VTYRSWGCPKTLLRYAPGRAKYAEDGGCNKCPHSRYRVLQCARTSPELRRRTARRISVHRRQFRPGRRPEFVAGGKWIVRQRRRLRGRDLERPCPVDGVEESRALKMAMYARGICGRGEVEPPRLRRGLARCRRLQAGTWRGERRAREEALSISGFRPSHSHRRGPGRRGGGASAVEAEARPQTAFAHRRGASSPAPSRVDPARFYFPKGRGPEFDPLNGDPP
jgi:hypothetical protein